MSVHFFIDLQPHAKAVLRSLHDFWRYEQFKDVGFAASKILEKLFMLLWKTVGPVGVMLRIAPRHQLRIVVQQKLQDCDFLRLAVIADIDTAQLVEQRRQIIHVGITPAFTKFRLQAHHIARCSEVAAHRHFAVVDVRQQVIGKGVSDIA